jgi:hypothetical protein
MLLSVMRIGAAQDGHTRSGLADTGMVSTGAARLQHVPMATRPLRLGQSLVDSERLERRHLRAALDEQQGSGRRLGDILVRRGYVDDKAVARSLAVSAEPPLHRGTPRLRGRSGTEEGAGRMMASHDLPHRVADGVGEEAQDAC